MNTSEELFGLALIKRCVWLSAKICLTALMAICLVCWIGLAGLVVYKSQKIGVSPLEIIQATTNAPSSSILQNKMIKEGLYYSLQFVLVGTACCTFVGAGVGVVVAMLKNRRAKN